jgi:hypothetical protein
MDYYSHLYHLAIGCCGGTIAETLHWHRIARRGNWPKYATSVTYWAITCLLILSGGVVAAAVSSPGTSPLQLLLLGIVGPQLLETTARAQRLTLPKKAPSDEEVYFGGERPSLGDFLAS